MNGKKVHKTKIKWLVLVEVIIFYFCFLNIVSHARGPAPYRVDTNARLLQARDFVPFFDMGDSRTEFVLPFLNNEDGVAAGYQALLVLKDIEGINIQFCVDCPGEYAGAALYIDLYNGEENYDSPEQEQQIILQQGQNDVNVCLNPGQQAPEACWVRVFTTNRASYELQNINIFEVQNMPKLTPAMVGVVILSLIILGCTLFFVLFLARKKEC